MFKENDLIRRITEDGSGEIVRVLEADYPNEYGSIHIAVGNDDDDTWVDPEDYELVTDDQTVHEDNEPQVANIPTKTQEEIHEDISKMFVQATQFLEANLDDERIELEIIGETNSKGISIAFKARVHYEPWVISSNLFRSAEVALARFKEDQGLKPLAIPMFKEAAE